MDEISELQKKRAVNIIWSAAQRYDFTPDFKAYDGEGKAEVYWNYIIGAVRRDYEYEKLEGIFRSFADYDEGDEYEALLWLGLENCVYGREVGERPILRALRLDYAERFTASCRTADEFHLYDALAYAHFSGVLGRGARLNGYDRKLLDELEFSPDMSTDEIVERTKELFYRWFQIVAEQRKKLRRRSPPALFARRRAGKGRPRYRKFALGFADHPKNIYGGAAAGGVTEENGRLTTMSAEELREFMAVKYGRGIYSAKEISDIERSLCTDRHADCHLHFTRGETVRGKNQNGFEALQKNSEAKQIEKNRRSYEESLARNRVSIEKLAAKIQNSVLLHLQPSPVAANAGRLRAGLVWRAEKLNDDRIFIRDNQSDMGNLCVDILLDASTSQKYRQETVSAQGYMIAQSLTKCGIPCRVSSFCSMTGYTVLKIFRGYNEPGRNGEIFNYVSNGCNRDGLAIRAIHHLINQESYDHKLLIILSDVKPNDVRKIRPAAGGELVPYEEGAGITDTAFEVRRARADGISVMCVFTGTDEDLPGAKLVYGRDFARIESLDKLSDAVGLLIQNQIKNF